MTPKDYVVIILIIMVSVAISLFVGYGYSQHQAKQGKEWMDNQTQEIAQQRLILDSLRLAGNQTITFIEKRYYQAKKPIPLVDNEDSLLVSINRLLAKKNPNQ